MSWLYAVRDCEGFEHAALVDPSPAALKSAGEIVGIGPERQFTSLEEALAAVTADGLIDVTPAPFHQYTTTMALQAGLAVLSERPPCFVAVDAGSLPDAMIKHLRDLGHTVVVMPHAARTSRSNYRRTAKDVCQLALGLAESYSSSTSRTLQ